MIPEKYFSVVFSSLNPMENKLFTFYFENTFCLFTYIHPLCIYEKYFRHSCYNYLKVGAIKLIKTKTGI